MVNNSTIMIFVDGIGIGKKDPEYNPFFKYYFDTFSEVFGQTPHLDNQKFNANGIYFFPTDANLGIEGLPQSGTGQTSIFCGINAPKKIGKHFGPFPYSTLIPIIEKKNIFKSFTELGKSVSFVNAYPKIFFDYLNSGRKRLSATSLSCLLTGIRLNNSTDLRKGNALSAEIDNNRWVSRLNYKLPIIQPKTAARRLLRIADKNHFTLFEYFFSDHMGHGRDVGPIKDVLKTFDQFLFFMLTNLNSNQTLIICSDHGNLEDLSIKSHTRNPALTITAGKNAKELSQKIKRLDQIKPALLRYYK